MFEIIKQMSAEPLIRELFRALQATIHERLSLVENILNTIEKPKVPLYDHEFIHRIERLEQQMSYQQNHVNHPPPMMNMNMNSVFDKEMLEERIVALEEQLAAACAQIEHLAEERERPTEKAIESMPSVILIREEDVAEPIEEEEEEEVEIAEEEEEEEGVELELEEYPYKGRTFYKDQSDNIYRADDEGEVIPEPIGLLVGKKIVWS
jgi:hypothetical protein